MKSIKKAKLGGSRSVGSVSKKFCKKEGNSNLSMVGGKCLYMNSRTHPYYLRSCKRNIDSLPDDLISYILVRLPADFLHDKVRFVCRRWSLIINSDAFVTSQIQHSTYGLLLSFHSGECGGHPILMTARRGRIEVSQFDYVCSRALLTSSNGLVAELHWDIKEYIGSIKINNPATKQSHPIPSLEPNCRCLYSKCAIAFDETSFKYKLTIPYYECRGLCLAILTFGVDNSWRNVSMEHVPKDYRYLLHEIPLITEGFMHWVKPGSSSVLTMDVENEIVRVLKPSYHPLVGCRPLNYYLSTGKSLSLLIECGAFSWQVWGMKSETGEWRKVLPDINLGGEKRRLQKFASTGVYDYQLLEPFGWVKYPEILAFHFVGESRVCIFYNLYTHQISTTELPAPCDSYFAFVYKNSLVRLG